MPSISDFSKDDRVVFGRTHGEQTLGTVVKVNRTRLKVRQDEARGSMRNYPVGTVWTVPPSLCRKVGQAPAPQPAPQRQATRPPLPRGVWNVGDRVEFTGKRGERVTGTVKRVNPKTVTVTPDNPRRPGSYYRVSPGLLRPEGCTTSEEGRPVLINVLTGERTVGRVGESEDSLFGRMANGLL